MILLLGLGSCNLFPLKLCASTPTDLKIGTRSGPVTVGQTFELYATSSDLFPPCTVSWISENPRVLRVANSHVDSTQATGIAPGTATVRVVVGPDTALVTVTVVP